MASPGLPPPTPAQLRGEKLYGDDLTVDQVERWFRDEADAYFEMSGSSQDPANYGYRELNRQTLFRHVPKDRRFRHALGFGEHPHVCGGGRRVELPLGVEGQAVEMPQRLAPAERAALFV